MSEDRLTLPRGVVKACAGIVEGCHTEVYRAAIEIASRAVGSGYDRKAEPQRQRLVKAVMENLINRKQNPYSVLQRRYGLCESERQFWREKRRFCYALAESLRMIETKGKAPGQA